MKTFARQISPEYQENPLFLGEDFFPDNIAVCGNRDYCEHLPATFEKVREVLTAGKKIAFCAPFFPSLQGKYGNGE